MKRPSPQPRAFTLVEVTVALGVIAFGLITLIGLLPAGLRTLGDSMDQTAHAMIVQRISNDLRQAAFQNNLPSSLYFDADGQPVNYAEEARYEAELNSSIDPSLPGVKEESELTALRPNLKRIQVSLKRIDIPNSSPILFSLQIAPSRSTE